MCLHRPRASGVPRDYHVCQGVAGICFAIRAKSSTRLPRSCLAFSSPSGGLAMTLFASTTDTCHDSASRVVSVAPASPRPRRPNALMAYEGGVVARHWRRWLLRVGSEISGQLWCQDATDFARTSRRWTCRRHLQKACPYNLGTWPPPSSAVSPALSLKQQAHLHKLKLMAPNLDSLGLLSLTFVHSFVPRPAASPARSSMKHPRQASQRVPGRIVVVRSAISPTAASSRRHAHPPPGEAADHAGHESTLCPARVRSPRD